MHVSVSVPTRVVMVFFVNGVCHAKPLEQKHRHKSRKDGEPQHTRSERECLTRIGAKCCGVKTLRKNHQQRRTQQKPGRNAGDIPKLAIRETVRERARRQATTEGQHQDGGCKKNDCHPDTVASCPGWTNRDQPGTI